MPVAALAAHTNGVDQPVKFLLEDVAFQAWKRSTTLYFHGSCLLMRQIDGRAVRKHPLRELCWHSPIDRLVPVDIYQYIQACADATHAVDWT